MKFPLSCLLLAVSLTSCCSSAGAQDPAPTAPAASSAQSAEVTSPSTSSSSVRATIPGPLRSFLRMAGISQGASLEEVLPLLARNVEMRGYHGSQERPGSPTEFLALLEKYVEQARDLRALAAPHGVIHISGCDDAQPLLTIIGYRFRQGCGGQHTSLETANPERAFLTIDSGFPLAELEQKLRTGKPFAYSYSELEAPVLLAPSDWMLNEGNTKKGAQDDLIEAILRNRALARLYWAMSRIDDQTRLALRESPGIRKLAHVSAALDFYGSHICIRGGRVVVPGGEPSESAWKSSGWSRPGLSRRFRSPAAFEG